MGAKGNFGSTKAWATLSTTHRAAYASLGMWNYRREFAYSHSLPPSTVALMSMNSECSSDMDDDDILDDVRFQGSYLVLVDPFQKSEIGEKEGKEEEKKREKKRKRREGRGERRREVTAN